MTEESREQAFEELANVAESMLNFMSGLALDPAIPLLKREVIRSKVGQYQVRVSASIEKFEAKDE